ncbi:MAG: tyrosine-type recombinase/integrase [Acidobacteriales bacterium]|nr:tyrosine-type recombinase/integrase [Terriglobales bacterium]
MARPARRSSPQGIHNGRRCTAVRRGAKERGAPKTERRGPTVARVVLAELTAWFACQNEARGVWHTHTGSSAKYLIASAGYTQVRDLSRADVLSAAAMYQKLAADTRYKRAQCLKKIIRWLVERHGASYTLLADVPKVTRPSPRAITATGKEREMLLRRAPLHLRCYILLCSDLALRKSTAAAICPNNYDSERREITFSTKYQNRLTLPVTAELAAMFALYTTDRITSYVSQMSPRGHNTASSLSLAFNKLRKECGITKQLTSHDLRRTTAARVYDLTRDLRKVQAVLGHKDLQTTLIYLDHHATPVEPSILELAKLNPHTEAIQ